MPTKEVAKRSRAPRKAAALGDQPTKAVFGIIFDLNGKLVPITTDDIPSSGEPFEFTLPGPITLGTIGEFIKWFNNKFGTNIPTDGYPYPLDQIIPKVNTLSFVVEKLHIKVTPVDKASSTKAYTLEMSATWSDTDMINLVPGLSIKGATFGVTNETEPKAEAS